MPALGHRATSMCPSVLIVALGHMQVIHSAASSVEHPRGTAIPLLHYEDTTWPLTLPSSASLSGITLPLAGCSLTSRAGQHSERLLRDSSTWTELKCRATETQTDCNGKDAKMEQLKQEVAGLRGAVSSVLSTPCSFSYTPMLQSTALCRRVPFKVKLFSLPRCCG